MSRRLALSAALALAVFAPAVVAMPPPGVDDPDSFGRATKWLGHMTFRMLYAPDCKPWSIYRPEIGCKEPAVFPASTYFHFADGLVFDLPPRASRSLLCHVVTPSVHWTYDNPGAVQLTAQALYGTSATIASPVLDDPALINAVTGQPFNGSLDAHLGVSLTRFVPLRPGEQLSPHDTSTVFCGAGMLSVATLVGTYGLTISQARKVFDGPIQVRMHFWGETAFVRTGGLTFAIRLLGD